MKVWRRHQSPDTLAYEERGSGPVLVLLHAFPLYREQFAEQLAPLSTHYRVLTPDLFGFGDSQQASGDWTIESQADTLSDWLESVALGEAVILGGVSMGGYVALAFARRHRHQLKGLLLIDTRAEADPPEGRANRDKAIELVASSGTGALLEGMLPKVLGATTHTSRPEVVQRVRELGQRQKPAGVIAGLKALRDRPDARADLSAIAVPTLVMVGREDTLTPPEVAQSLAAGISGAELVVLDGVGHLPNIEDPSLFQVTLDRFLSKHFGQ